MNLAYVSFVAPESVSGENAFMIGIARGLARRPGVHLSLICPAPAHGPDELLGHDIKVMYLPPKQSGSLRWTLGVQMAILRSLKQLDRTTGQLDGVIVALRAGAISPALYSWFNGVPEVLVVESLEGRNVARVYGHMPGSGVLMNLITWMNSRQSRRVFTAFDAVRAWIQGMPLIDPAKVERFHHGVDMTHHQMGEAELSRGTVSLPFAVEDYVVGFAGSFKWYHRVDLLLRAAAQPELEHAKLLLIGQGPTLDECRSLASELGIGDRVNFTGHVPHDRVGPLLSSCDALYGVIDPSHWGHAMKLYEYMASGAPFVYVINDETRFLEKLGIGVGILSASAEEVVGALSDVRAWPPDRRRGAAERARSFVMRECTWDGLASRIVAAVGQPAESEA